MAPCPSRPGKRRQRGRGLGLYGPRSVAVAGGLLALLVLVVAASFAWYERQQRIADEEDHLELLARVLEDHATRSIDTASLALSALAEVVAKGDLEGDNQLGWVLAQSVAGLPLLRNVAVLDAQGLVLASTDATTIGTVINPRRLGRLPAEGQELFGAFVAGRGLAALVPAHDEATAPPGVGFLPLMRHVKTRSARSLLLIGLINPDLLANYQQQLLADRRSSAVLADLDGRVLAATPDSGLLPGATVHTLDIYTRFLPAVEHESYLGAGTREGEQLVSFRVSRTRPLVLEVEMSLDAALAGWRRDARGLTLVAGLVAAAIVLLSQVAARSLAARARAGQQRDAAQAEVALREHELSVIVKSVKEILFRTEGQGRLTFVNARWQSATGAAEPAALGSTLADRVRPASAAAAQALFAPDGPAGLRTAELQMGPDDHVRHFEVAVAPLLDRGRVAGYAGSAVDVTAQHTAQARLQAQLAFTELLLDLLPIPMSSMDTEGRYLSVNQAWQEFTGRPRADVLGRLAADFALPAQAEQHAREDAALLARGGRTRYESTALHRDGSVRDLAVTKVVVPGAGGKPASILAAFMDVTEFRDAERATREARDAAEETSRSKTEFIANISHELRTPLQSIIGFSELGRARSGEQQRLGMMFNDIHSAGHRMLALVNDLLDVAKIESTVGTFHLERTDIRPLVRDVLGELGPLLSARHIALELQLSPAPLVAKVDPLRLQQVVRNVVANAIRFSPVGQVLRVVGGIDDDQNIRISVRDSGPGIPPAELDLIFEAFVQSSKTKDGSGGTGLGLAISRKIVQAHGGEIHAQNNVDRGATFHIVLPARGFALTQMQV